MKLKFKNQEFQSDAVNVVADLFLGQEQLHSSFAIEMESANSMLETDYGIGNKLVVDTKTVAENMHAVQRRQGLPLTNEGLEDRDQRLEGQDLMEFQINTAHIVKPHYYFPLILNTSAKIHQL